MTKEEIIEMARHADREWDCDRDMFEWLETFAKLVEEALKQEQGEPVAWRAPNWGHDNDTRPWSYRDHDEPFYPPEVGEPLYTKPQPKQEQGEPVGKFAKFTDGIWREVTDGSAGVPLYTHSKEWVGLTDDQMRAIAEWQLSAHRPLIEVIKAVEQALKEKNHVDTQP